MASRQRIATLSLLGIIVIQSLFIIIWYEKLSEQNHPAVNTTSETNNETQLQQQQTSVVGEGRHQLPLQVVATTNNRKKNQFAFIVGTAMHVHKFVNHVAMNLQIVAEKNFENKNYHIIISEEGSPHDWTNTTIPTDKLTVVRTEKNPFRDRISRLAYARNQYLELVLRRYSEIQNDYDDCYMIVFDLDFSCEIDFETIGKALVLREHWDAISFNIANYWDWYAFEAIDHGSSVSDRTKFLQDLNSLKENELLEVTSAFHIAAMYKLPHLMNTKYEYKNGECEHKGLHKMMKKKHNSMIMVSPMPLYRFGCI